MNRLGWVGLVVLASCGEREATLEVCAPLPETLHLGTVALGASNRVVLLGVGLPTGAATVDGADFQVSRDDTGLAVSVTPTSLGRRTALLRVEDPTCGARTSQLTVDAVESCVDVPASLTFVPTERTCGRAAASLPVTNRCAEPVRLDATVVEPTDAPDAWCRGGQPCLDFRVTEGPRAVPARGQASYQLVATPSAVGEARGTLRIAVGQGDGTAVHEVALTAQGLDRPRFTETFQAAPLPQVTLLMVLDTSAASVQHRASTRQNLASFGTYMRYSGLRLTVHVSTAGLSPGPVVTLTSDTDRLEVALPAVLDRLPAVNEPSCAQGLLSLGEQVLAPARPAFTAGLCLMFTRDAAQQAWWPLVARLEKALRTVSVVGPFLSVPGCRGEEDVDNGALQALASRTGGVMEESCTPDWATALQSISTGPPPCDLFAYLSRPALREPDLVRYRNRDYPPLDVRGARNWHWDPRLNLVTFDPSSCPEPGGPPVEMVYEPACDDPTP